MGRWSCVGADFPQYGPGRRDALDGMEEQDMRLVTTAAEARAHSRTVLVNGRDYTIAEYVGAAPVKGHYVDGNEANDNGLPQGFLVHQPADAITPAHFHEPNQFQVFVGGNGRMGAFPARPLTVQYANGHTPYGPIVAGPEGVQYFTLRQRWDPGAKYLPASRDKLRKGNQRSRIKGGLDVSTEAERQARTGVGVETVVPPEADGLAAWLYRLAPVSKAPLPAPSTGGGQYLINVGGSLIFAGQSLGPLSTVFLSPEEPAATISAGSDGGDVLVLQFPRLGSEPHRGS